MKITALRPGWAEQEPSDWWKNLKLASFGDETSRNSGRANPGHRDYLADARTGIG